MDQFVRANRVKFFAAGQTARQTFIGFMFISPALEELSEPGNASGTDTLRPVPSSVHDPPSVEVQYPADMTATGSSDMDGFKRDLTRQLVGVDQQTFERVKQAIRSALSSQAASADPSSVLQVN